MSDRLMNGEKLEYGQSLTSRNGAYTLTLQHDGNLVLAARGQAVWATGTNGHNVERLEVQKDGNCLLYTPDKPVWHTDTKGAKDVRLLLQDDRNLVLYGFDGPAWASNTQPRHPKWFRPPQRSRRHPQRSRRHPHRRRSLNRQLRRRHHLRRLLRGRTPWSPATPCGPSRNASTATAANTG
jgi:hypothetical protein